MTKEQRERLLRQEIHALRVKKLGYTVEQFRTLLKYIGFGESLSILDELALLELKVVLIRFRKRGRPDEYTYDKQGNFMHFLMIRAGWDDVQLRTFMINHYKKTHWNLLDHNERKAVIATLQYYVDKREKEVLAQELKEENNHNIDINKQ
jgi:hypothetical protein